jgi:hypothetical protein
LKNKKVLFLKKYFLSRFQYQNKKTLFTGSIFREGFGNIVIAKSVFQKKMHPDWQFSIKSVVTVKPSIKVHRFRQGSVSASE